jgi:hypothetical protein
MEQKKNNIFMPLLLYSLKNKRNWFLLSTVIILVTTMLIPFILRVEEELFIAFGIFEVFVLVFINCLVDNSFLHNDSKLAYYKSKPATLRQQISINIIINVIFAAYLLLLIVLSVVFQKIDYEIFESFKLIIPWLSAGIFLAALSSVLSGNTLIAGVMTIFNFALPAIIYLIIQFMFSILENMVAGFSANVLMDYFVNNFYKLEYIYFSAYQNMDLDFIYFLLLGVILVGITLLIFKMLKKRKNENTGSFIVFDGYKYFVSVIACLIVPAAFSVVSYNNNIVSGIFVSLLMAALTYYIIIAAMERSFRISNLSMKVFVISMAVFVAMTGSTVVIASRYKNVVPAAEDVRVAYVGNDGWLYNSIKRYIEDDGQLSEDDISVLRENYGTVLFTDRENIETVTDLHKEILSDNNYYDEKEYYYSPQIDIIYGMKDGSFIIREYRIYNNSGADNATKDEIAHRLLNSQEFKEKNYYYLYDEKYYSGNDYLLSFRLWYNGIESASVELNTEGIRQHLIKDIDEKSGKTDNNFLRLSSYNYDMPYKEYDGIMYYLDIDVIDKNRPDYYEGGKPVYNDKVYTIELDEDFKNTRKYLNLK